VGKETTGKGNWLEKKKGLSSPIQESKHTTEKENLLATWGENGLTFGGGEIAKAAEKGKREGGSHSWGKQLKKGGVQERKAKNKNMEYFLHEGGTRKDRNENGGEGGTTRMGKATAKG